MSGTASSSRGDHAPPRGHEFYAGVTGAQQCTGAERPHGDVLVAVVDRKMPQAFRAAFAARP